MVKGGLKGSKWNDGEQTGIQDGDWTYYRKDGNIDDARTYAKGKLINSKNFTLYFDSARLVCTIATGKPFTGQLNKTGIVDEYLFPNRYTVQVINGQYEGEFCSYYSIEDDLIVAATATYTNGELNGQLKKYHTNGQLMTNAVYVNGKIEGNYTVYYADSIVKRPYGDIEYTCSYKNGNRNGVARWYYENGVLEEEAEYSKGIREGILRKYYQDGKLSSMYNYRNGEKDGIFQSYDVDGSYEKGSYEEGEISLRERYRADGTLISVYQWRNGECIRNDNYDRNGNLI